VNIVRIKECQVCGTGNFIGLETRSAGVEDKFLEALGIKGEASWCMCTTCCFIFQNPRPSRTVLEDFYRRSGYRQTGKELIEEGYKAFAPQILTRLAPWLYVNGLDLSQIRNKNCLDFGCGIGGALTFLAAQDNVNYGVEIDSALAAYGNQTYPVRIVPAVEDLPPDVQFDLIFANHALEHVYDPNDFGAFAARRLKDTGIIVIAVPSWRYANTTSALNGFTSEDGAMFDHVSLALLLNKHGFYLSAFCYQNYGRGGDWELLAMAIKSHKKNCFTTNVPEVLTELYVNLPKRLQAQHGVRPGEERFGVSLGS
jgi:SAM-dependent methyltransferase